MTSTHLRLALVAFLLLGCTAFSGFADDEDSTNRRVKALAGRWEGIQVRSDYVELLSNGSCRFRLDGREELKAEWEYYDGTLRLVYLGTDGKTPVVSALTVDSVTGSYLVVSAKRAFQRK